MLNSPSEKITFLWNFCHLFPVLLSWKGPSFSNRRWGVGHGWVGGWLLVVVVLQLGVFIFKLRRGAPFVLMWGFHKKNYEMGGTIPPPPLAKTLQKEAIMQLFKSRA